MSFTCKQLRITHEETVLVDIGFTIEHSLALVGQSGSGKSLSLKALLKMVPSTLNVTLETDDHRMLHKGKSVSFVPQNPFTALSPLTTIKEQFFMDEATIASYLSLVGLEAKLMERFPMELSGGQLQRVIIAMALALKPELLLMDEPTTALDTKTKEAILELIASLQVKEGFKLLFVTHDMSSAQLLCRDIAVIHEGKIIERGCMEKVITRPEHAYTKKLIEAGFKTRGFRQ